MVKHTKQHGKNLIVNLDDDEGSHSYRTLLVALIHTFYDKDIL